MAQSLKLLTKITDNKVVKFSHKQLVLVAAPISIGAYFFLSNRVIPKSPVTLPNESNTISTTSKDRLGTKYFCINSITIPYTITHKAIFVNRDTEVVAWRVKG